MALIPCARECVYQSDGCCDLKEVYGGTGGDADCSYFIARASVSEKASARLENRLDADNVHRG